MGVGTGLLYNGQWAVTFIAPEGVHLSWYLTLKKTAIQRLGGECGIEQKQILFFPYKDINWGIWEMERSPLCQGIRIVSYLEKGRRRGREADGAGQCEASQVTGKHWGFFPSETRRHCRLWKGRVHFMKITWAALWRHCGDFVERGVRQSWKLQDGLGAIAEG